MNKFKINYKSPIGNLILISDEEYLTNVMFDVDNHNIISSENVPLILEQAIKQLDEYFNKKRKEFDLKIRLEGTEFQKQVWNELTKIPYGKTYTYKQIANNIGNIKACRAVGNANNKNPIPIIVPCHRVIGTNNKLVGYAGGLEIKRYLLDLEV